MQLFLVKISTHKNVQKEVKVTQLVSALFQIIPSLFPSGALYTYSFVSTYIGSYPLLCISNDVGLLLLHIQIEPKDQEGRG